MKNAFEMTKKKVLIVVAFLAVLSGTMIASVPNVAADMTSSVYAIVKSILTTVQSIQTTAESIQTTVQNTNNNLNNVKIEAVITGPPLNISEHLGTFNITANQPWDLVEVYITTNGIGLIETSNNVFVQTQLDYGIFKIGSRQYDLQTSVTVAQGSDATDFPIFAGDMTNKTQSFIPVPSNVPVYVSWGRIQNYLPAQGFVVSYKLVIQRPIDPSFSYDVTWG